MQLRNECFIVPLKIPSITLIASTILSLLSANRKPSPGANTKLPVPGEGWRCLAWALPPRLPAPRNGPAGARRS